MNTISYTPEVGDVFIITRKSPPYSTAYNGGRYRNQPCLYVDKRYIIKSFSKSGLSVYYEDNRTNIKCKCNNCRVSATAGLEYGYDDKGNWGIVGRSTVRCIGISDIKIVEKRVQRDRDIKIKLLGL